MTTSPASQVLFRMADSGNTYMYWRWLDNPDNPKYHVLESENLKRIESLIDEAMVDPRKGVANETGEESVRRALLDGPLSDPGKELAWSTELANLVLPAALVDELIARHEAGESIRFRVLPSPRMARVPWELLPLTNGLRVLEAATVYLDAPAVINSNRGRNPEPWQDAKSRPPLYLLEPKLHEHLFDGYEGKVIGKDARNLLGPSMGGAHGLISRTQLGTLLRGEETSPERAGRFRLLPEEKPSRMLYYGHAESTPNEPGSAAIHLTDNIQMHGNAFIAEGTHRPFTALDLLIGTDGIYLRDAELQYPHPDNVPGHQIWPMPPRVALIACESGADHRALETFGMIMAVLNAGAEIVTSTRWTLATDYALQHLAGFDGLATTEVVLTVDRAHASEDPVEEIRKWQLSKLNSWRAGAGIQNTPLIWASLTTHIAPEQAPITSDELLAASVFLGVQGS